MGCTPAIASVNERQLIETLQPLPTPGLPQLLIGVLMEKQLGTGMLLPLQSVDQFLLMISPQPGGPAGSHQIPDQQHRCLNPGTAVDHIAAEHEMIPLGEDSKQFQKSPVTAMHIPDDPVVAAGCSHR